MNVGTLQQFLRSLVPALNAADAGARVATDLERACRGLEPFRALELDAFAGFLTRCEEFGRSGAVAPPSEIDLGPVQQSLRRLTQARERLESVADADSAKSELIQGQRELKEALTVLTDSVGLSGNQKKADAWIEVQLRRARARARVRALRELAAHITEPAAYERDDVRAAIAHLGNEIAADEWKQVAAEFAMKTPAKGKGVAGVEEVLFRLTSHRPLKTKAPRQRGATALDPAEVANHAEELRSLIERSKDSSRVSESEIENELNRLNALTAPMLAAIAKQAGIDKPGSGKANVLRTIKGRLTATRRTMAENEL